MTMNIVAIWGVFGLTVYALYVVANEITALRNRVNDLEIKVQRAWEAK